MNGRHIIDRAGLSGGKHCAARSGKRPLEQSGNLDVFARIEHDLAG